MTVDEFIVLVLKKMPEIFAPYWNMLWSGDPNSIATAIIVIIGLAIILRALPIMWIRDKLGY